MDQRQGWEEATPSLQTWKAGLRRRAGHHPEKVANSSPSHWSEAQATDFDQNKTGHTGVHYSKTSVELARGSLWLESQQAEMEGRRLGLHLGWGQHGLG